MAAPTAMEIRAYNALKGLQAAMNELNEVWGTEEGRAILDTACERAEYPFHKSFDELTCEVGEWTRTRHEIATTKEG